MVSNSHRWKGNNGKISRKTTLEIEVEGKTLRCTFYVMSLGDVEVILGNGWLKEADPIIGWKDLSISYKEKLMGKNANIKSDIPTEFEDFIDLFQEEGFSELPEHREYDCSIDFKEGAQLPPPGKVYPMSPIESRAIKEYLSKELKDGKIRRSNSPVAAPCFFVKKADGSLRLVVDYRKINEITIPMPSQTDLIEKLKGAKIFSKMDIRWGFNNIRIKEGDEWKTAFRTSRGQYKNLVMPFGLMNAPAVFQEFMNAIFRDVIDEWVVIYMDDILIFSNDREEHTGHVHEVLSRLRKHHLF
jgi:hypothetical protein